MDLTDHGFMAFSNSSFSGHQQPQLPLNFTDNIQNYSNPEDPSAALAVHSMALTDDFGQSMVNLSTPPASSGTGLGGNNKSLGRRKGKRKYETDVEKPKEVIHVRAKRGQATDSHSLAERVRREKINERLRSLQALVPGCYKTMGMSVMLDVIINYVQSLQNQIEFLSMKLSAASMYYDFNLSETEAMETMQGTNAYEVQDMERMSREGYGEPSYLNPAWPL